jgi:arginine repressor
MSLDKYTSNLVSSIDDNGQVIVVTTYSGGATLVAQAIDESNIDNILGTLGGDNITLVIVKNVANLAATKTAIKTLLGK